MKLCTMLDNDKRKKVTKPDYPKNFGSSKKSKNVVKMTVFWLFLKNGSNDFDETCSECRSNQFWAPRENRMSKSFSVLEIIIHKVQILAQIAKSGVQRMRYISRTINAIENLIWYSECTINSLSWRLIRFLPTCRLQGVILPWKRPIFMHFLDDLCSISRQPLERFWSNLLWSET